MRTSWLWIGAVLLIGALAMYFFWPRQSPAVRFTTAQVDRGPIVAKVTASGTLSALVTVQVGSQVSGRIKEILVDYNSPVQKGDLIAKIDPQLFEAALEQARANFVAAQSDLTGAQAQALDAERQFRRAQDLAGRQIVTQADLDTAQANFTVASAQVAVAEGRVAQAQASLNQTEVNLTYTNILSPISGVVISRNVDVGQTVAASFQAPTLFVIAEDLRKMQVDTSVAEADIGKLEPGMKATFSVDAYPTDLFSGAVRQIRNAPQTLQNVVTYDAVIDVDNAALKLRPGMTANVTFIIAEREDALRVPNSALRFRPSAELLATARKPGGEAANGGPRSYNGGRSSRERDRRTIWVDERGTPEPVVVKLGISDGSLTEVLEGDLQAGDTVIVDASTTGQSGDFRGGGGPFPRHF